jgi:Ca2+-binding RTX toxin-like protein
MVIDASNVASFGDRASLTEADTFETLEVHLPLSVGGVEEHVGSWTVLVDHNGTNSVDYSVSAITESTLRMDVDVADPPPGQDYFVPGDQIPFTVTLTGDDRVPLGYSSVSLFPVGPIVNLNSILAGGMISQAQLDAIPTESRGEPLSKTQRMIMAFEQAHGSTDPLLMQLDPISLTMEYDPDDPELFGEWTGTFDSTEIPGPYTFVIRADGCSDACEPFSREITRSVLVYEEVDPLLTGIDIEMPGNDTIVVTVTPTNSDGTIYGPSLNDGDLVIGFGDGLNGSGTFTNNLDGSYTVTLEIGDGQLTEDLEVWVHGTMLATQTVNMREAWLQIEGRPAKDFGQDAALNVAILGQANGVTGIALKPVDSPPWAAMNNELTGNNALWQLSDGIIRIAATLNQEDGSSIDATMPADLPVGEYTVQLETTSGLGPIDRNVTYRVIGRGSDLPERVQLVDNRLETLESGQMDGNSDWRSLGEQLVREILELPLGERLTETIRFDAAKVVLETIGKSDFRCEDNWSSTHSGGAMFHSRENDVSCIRPDLKQDEFKPLLRAVNLAHIDARFVDEPAATTATGDEIDVTLGSGVSLRIGTVSTAGESQVEIAEGDLDVPQYLRSKTHVVYDITTTASFASEDGVEISLAYEEGDFDSEDNVRLFHKEDGEWVDRTTSIDTTNNIVTGLTSSLSPFMMTETPDVSIADASVLEGDSGTTDMVFNVTLSDTTSMDVDVNYTVAADSATDGVDFTAVSGMVTIPAGSLLGTFSVPVHGDTIMEGIETLTVTLTGALSATVADGTATGTILDDEHSVTFTAATGALELVLGAGGSSAIDAVAGLVSLEINENPDPTFPVIAANEVTSILVTGSADADNVDLSKVSSASGFALLDAVTINAGSGNDTIIGSQINNKINGSGGDDALTGGTGNDTLSGGNGADSLIGGPGNDRLRGQGSSLDILSGGPGDDIIDGGTGYDHLFESADVSFTVTDNLLTGLGNDTLIEIQLAQLFGGSSANVIDGTAFSGRLFLNGSGGSDTLLGGPGADRMFGGSGPDVILGGEGNDLLRGQGGNQDSLVGGPGDDKLSGGIGADILDGGSGDDWLRGESGNDTITGGAGIDRLYEKADVDLTLTDSTMTGGLGTNVLSGIESAYFKGGNSANTFDASGFSGKTTLIGSGGDDRIIGGTADDLLVGRSGNDTISGGTGDDTLQGLRGDDTLIGGEGNDLLDGGTQADALSGQAGDDFLYGRSGDDSLVGGDGSDVLFGGDDDDVAVGDDGKDDTSSTKDDDTVDGGSGTDTVRGGGGLDTLVDSISEIDETFEFLADWVDGV